MTPSKDYLENFFLKRPVNWQDQIKMGLDRIRGAYRELNEPIKSTFNILVAGTNGKGSTCAYLSMILQSTSPNLNIGIYSSPHLINFYERIQTSKKVLSNKEIICQLNKIKAQLSQETWLSLSFFELTTLCAFTLFDLHKTDINIIEVGLGGRYDATNIIQQQLSVITSIGYDHTEILGDSIEKITFEKAGIIKKNTPTICTFKDEKIRKIIATCCKEHSSRVEYNHELPTAKSLKNTPEFHHHNFKTALNTAILYYKKNNITVDSKVLVNNFDNNRSNIKKPFSLFARFEKWLSTNKRQWIFDVCHNELGAEAFVQAIKLQHNQKMIVFISILRDKEINKILDIIKTINLELVLFKSDGHRAMKKNQIAPRHKELQWFNNFKQAILAKESNNYQDYTFVVCGSVHVIGDVFVELERNL